MTGQDVTPPPRPSGQDDVFVTTRWTVVLAAGRQSTPDADAALAELCRAYWYPLYAYVRRRGHAHADAEDLTQAFFARFLSRNYLAGLSSERGKFRAFLLAALKHFLANEWDRTQRQKRGGGATHLSLDWDGAATRYQRDPDAAGSPEHCFDRAWAVALLERVIARLRDECAATGRADLFTHAQGFLTVGQDAVPYAAAARELGLEEGALRVAVHRLRKRYRDLLRQEIAQTLSDPANVEEELRSLQAALRS